MGSVALILAINSLASRSPGAMAPASIAASRLSRRRSALRAALSGPWHGKQFSARIGRTSRLYCSVTRSPAVAAADADRPGCEHEHSRSSVAERSLPFAGANAGQGTRATSDQAGASTGSPQEHVGPILGRMGHPAATGRSSDPRWTARLIIPQYASGGDLPDRSLRRVLGEVLIGSAAAIRQCRIAQPTNRCNRCTSVLLHFDARVHRSNRFAAIAPSSQSVCADDFSAGASTQGVPGR